MKDVVELSALVLFAAAPLAAALTGYAVVRAHYRAGSSHPVWRGVGVIAGLLVAVPATFFLAGRSLAGEPTFGLLSLGLLALLGVGVYLLAGGGRPPLFRF